MRIVHLIDYFQPRLGYQESWLAREQIALGHDVTVLCSDRYFPFPNYDQTVRPLLGQRLLAPGRGTDQEIPVWRLPVRWERGTRALMKGVRHALKTLQPQVVHTHNIVKFHTLQAARYRRALGYALIADDHAHTVSINRRRSGQLFYRAFRRCIAPYLERRIDLVAPISSETAGIVRDVYGLKDVPLEVIELGVDTDLFRWNDQDRSQLRRELGVELNDRLIIYTGKIIPSKAPHLLVEALPLLPSSAKLLLVGNGPDDYLQKIRALIDRHQLTQRVFFHEAVPQDELPQYYSAADVGCWPRETSMAMIEAASCALPIVVVREGTEERIRHENGLAYDEGDVTQLAEQLGNLVSDPHRARAMGGRGRQLVEESYSWKHIVQLFEMQYERFV